MSNQRTPYVNSSSQHLPTYPPRPEQDQLTDDDYKSGYEDSIIDNYSQAEVSLPTRQPSQYRPSPYLHPPAERKPWQPPQPGIQKPSYSSDRSAGTDSVTDFNSHEYGSEAYALPPVKEKVEPPRSFWDKIIPDSIACRLYVLAVIIETGIDVGVEADLYLRFQASGVENRDGARRLPVYLAIFSFAHLFQLVMAIDAVYARNTLQFIFLTIFNGMILIYGVVQISEIQTILSPSTTGISHVPVSVLTITIPVVIGVAEIAYIALGWRIWSEFGWKVYKLLGADRRVKRMFAQYQIFVCLIKFDVFFFIGFTVQLIWLVLQRQNWEWFVTCAALPLSFLLLLAGHFAVRNEHKWMMLSFMGGCVGAMVYFVYKLFKIYRNRASLEDTLKSLVVFAIIAIFLLLATFIMGIIVMRNFGAGLKYHMSKTKKSQGSELRRRVTEHHPQQSVYPMSANPNRMSID